ncbi:uncharacterized protein LOC129597712 [Paramacrobiotus metropolitanus]|uniref:uncharacterized protein LOC129597712 n=1 Tax=Paramacrobiotus metropolitanus TaxID=2943436 RepID=UPI0024463798|nr:uncharacterized protein LOC129597712 [Paramacrobiotus metropolitanus]
MIMGNRFLACAENVAIYTSKRTCFGKFWLLLFLICVSVSRTSVNGHSIPVGAAYVGSGYDILTGNPEGASFTSGGLDPGLKAAKFVLEKTFGQASGYCPDEATCVELGGTISQETFTLTADLQQYKSEFSALWDIDNDANILIASFGGTLSASYKEAKNLIKAQEKVILNAHRISIAGDITYNVRSYRKLGSEFLDALCELPSNYSRNDYINFLKEWGTHVIIGAKIGIRESVRQEFTKNVVINHLQKNQSYTISSRGGVLSFITSSLTGTVSDQIIDDLRSGKESLKRWITAMGSPANPAPISLMLRGIEKFIVAGSVLNDSRNGCPRLQTDADIALFRANIQHALTEYPVVTGAEIPAPVVRTMKLTWPRGNYALFMANTGCPEGYWADGSRYHDTVDRFPNNQWSAQFDTLTSSSFWSNNLNLQFCTKLIDFDENSLDWPQGAYCFFKKGECPAGFDLGSYYVDDEFFFNRNSYSGTLPDGEYYRKTKYFFCCRDDGALNKPMILPTQKPFFLFPVGPACQTVNGMTSSLHWLKIHTMWKGWTTMTGKHPFATADTKTRWTWYFCYYTATE